MGRKQEDIMTEDATKKFRRLLDELVPEEAREHALAAGKELKKGLEALLPDGVSAHSRTARREALLTLRSLVDAAIKRLDSSGDK